MAGKTLPYDCRDAIRCAEELLSVGEQRWNDAYFLEAALLITDAMKAPHECHVCHYTLALVHTRLVSYTLHALKKKNEARNVLERALQHAERAIRLNEEDANSHALLGYALAVRSGLLGWRGMGSGARSKFEFERARRLDAENPRLYLFRGIALYSTPAIFGGSLERARRDLQQAVSLFEERKSKGKEIGWGHEEAWHWLARCYAKMGDQRKALHVLREGSKRFPDHSRLRQSLFSVEEAWRNNRQRQPGGIGV